MHSRCVPPADPQEPGGGTIHAEHEQTTAWLKSGLTLAKISTLVGHRGMGSSYHLNHYATTELDVGCRQGTEPVADCQAGAAVQVDFGRLGMLTDTADGRCRVVDGLIFPAVYSRHTVVWLTYRQTLIDVIAGFEAAWAFLARLSTGDSRPRSTRCLKPKQPGPGLVTSREPRLGPACGGVGNGLDEGAPQDFTGWGRG